MKFKTYLPIAGGLLAFTLFGCNNNQTGQAGNNQADSTQVANKADSTVYVCHLTGLNSNITGKQTTGEARFVIADGNMKVTIDVQNAPANMEHWQHFHGFADGKDAQPASMAQDANHDGILDVAETGAVSGTTMVPFNKIPAAMNLGDNTYPTSDSAGNYHYEAVIPMTQLQDAFSKAFNGGQIDLDKRVLYIHGVPDNTKLPKTVASVADIPAQVTLPIAVGKIELEQK